MADAPMPPGVARYIAAAQETMRRHAANVAEIRRCRFDTIAVHGLYTMEEALDRNQGAIIEPIYMSTSQGYRDSDEMEAALAYLVPTWCYSRIANPSLYYSRTRWPCSRGTASTARPPAAPPPPGWPRSSARPSRFSRRSAAPAPADELRLHLPGLRRHVPAVLRAQDQERGIECRWVANSRDLDEWASKIDENTRFLYGELPSNPGQSFFDLAAVASSRTSTASRSSSTPPWPRPALLRPLCHGADVVVHSVTKTMTSSGFGIAGAVIARKNLTCRYRLSDAMCEDFAMYLKYLPNRDNGPSLSPMTGDPDAERHAHAALQDRPLQPEHDAGGGVPRAATRRSSKSTTSGLPQPPAARAGAAATCSSSTPSTTRSTARRSTATAT